jgi:hypothetical protein
VIYHPDMIPIVPWIVCVALLVALAFIAGHRNGVESERESRKKERR